MGSAAGWTPVAEPSTSAWTPVQETPKEQPSNLQRFAQSWWDHSVLKHPIDSAVGLVKSLVTFPDYHTLTQDEKDQVDKHLGDAFSAAAHPTPELAGQVTSEGTNAAVLAGATAGLGKALGAVVDNADVIKGAAKGAAKATTETAHFKGFDIPGGNVMAGTAGGSIAARAVGLPGAAGAVVGGAAPIVRGAIQGGRAALAARITAAATEAKILHPDIAASMLESLNEDDGATFSPQNGPAPLPISRQIAAPANVIIPPAPEDTSFVRSVPAQYPAGPVRPPLAQQPVAAAPVAETPAVQPKTDLEDLLEKSLKDPHIADAAKAELDQHLKDEGLKKAGDIIDRNQTKRALKLGRFLQDYGITPEHIESMTPEEWAQVGEVAEVPKPSAITVQKVKELMQMGRSAVQ